MLVSRKAMSPLLSRVHRCTRVHSRPLRGNKGVGLQLFHSRPFGAISNSNSNHGCSKTTDAEHGDSRKNHLLKKSDHLNSDGQGFSCSRTTRIHAALVPCWYTHEARCTRRSRPGWAGPENSQRYCTASGSQETILNDLSRNFTHGAAFC